MNCAKVLRNWVVISPKVKAQGPNGTLVEALPVKGGATLGSHRQNENCCGFAVADHRQGLGPINQLEFDFHSVFPGKEPPEFNQHPARLAGMIQERIGHPARGIGDHNAPG